jgi:DNA polymerase I-like protein with 3'-5' exonuclease and polymerase domains
MVFFDIETDGLSVDANTVWCIGISDLNQEGADVYGPGEIDKAIERLASASCVVGHNNIMFDCPVLESLHGARFNKRIDTLVTARLMYPDRHSSPVGGNSLAEWGQFLKFPKGGHSDWSKYSDEMAEYCGNDVLLTKEIYRYLSKRWSSWKKAIQLEHKVAEIISKQHWNGVSISIPAATHLYTLANTERTDLLKKLQDAFPPKIEFMKTPQYYFIEGISSEFARKSDAKDWARKNGIKAPIIGDGPMKFKEIPFNPASGDQIAERLIAKYNWKPKITTESGKPSTEGDVLEKLSDKYPEAKMIVDWRMCQNRANIAETWIKCISPNTNRLHHSVNTNGAVTGRMTHSDPNVNCPKIRKGKNKEILYGFEGEYGFECRKCFEPRPGWYQVGADASGLELRMLAHYMAQYDGGEYVKQVTEGDVHTYNQKAAGLENRDQAKTFIYAFLYGAGDEKIGKIVKGTSKDGARLKETFLKGLPALAQLKKFCADCVSSGFIVGLDGRKIPIRSQHAALNTLLQSGGALVMKQALVFRYETINQQHVYGVDWADMLNVHDEYQSEARTQDIAKFIGLTSVDSIKKSGLYFGLACPLDGEYKIGKSWAECH